MEVQLPRCPDCDLDMRVRAVIKNVDQERGEMLRPLMDLLEQARRIRIPYQFFRREEEKDSTS
jgi:hypothetical protein